jgi:hypothetical protein
LLFVLCYGTIPPKKKEIEVRVAKRTQPCKKMWMIEMSRLWKIEEIKLKRDTDSHILNFDFLDMSIAIDDPIEQLP